MGRSPELFIDCPPEKLEPSDPEQSAFRQASGFYAQGDAPPTDGRAVYQRRLRHRDNWGYDFSVVGRSLEVALGISFTF